MFFTTRVQNGDILEPWAIGSPSRALSSESLPMFSAPPHVAAALAHQRSFGSGEGPSDWTAYLFQSHDSISTF